ncbi:hypothetical protein LTR66_009636 [Elasticomyces elasticus]|nr:hypothetical protein LTR66_009636 [Elasticomyces elasticus]
MTTYIPSVTLPGFLFEQPAAAILLPVALGTGVGFSVRPSETQKTYLALKQPPYRPPPQVFGPVWTLLYASMGYSAYRAWTTGMSSLNPVTVELAKQGATLYTVQLALNLIWMPLFFTGWLTYVWSQVDEVAGWALVPYLGWLTFATYLSFGAGYLNDWNFHDKERPIATKPKHTKYVDEKAK